MATYDWVGGNRTWDNASKTNWATTSGGAGSCYWQWGGIGMPRIAYNNFTGGEVSPTLTPEQYIELLTYIQALRDIPTQPGAPWDGGDDETPWPGTAGSIQISSSHFKNLTLS